MKSLVTYVNGRRQQTRRGNLRRVRVSFPGRKGGVAKVSVVAHLANGGKVSDRRSYRVCPAAS